TAWVREMLDFGPGAGRRGREASGPRAERGTGYTGGQAPSQYPRTVEGERIGRARVLPGVGRGRRFVGGPVRFSTSTSFLLPLESFEKPFPSPVGRGGHDASVATDVGARPSLPRGAGLRACHHAGADRPRPR